MSRPIENPAGELVDWNNVGTWLCFDCGTMDADEFEQFDGLIRCADCAAIWSEHHLDLGEWR